ncbi:MAG: hypothetical protein HY291_04515 [Planctomycetes bacterium]|nr:hypothetical protein [Planctomycetota bacterium]
MIAAALMLGVNTRPYPPNWMAVNLFVPLDYEIVLDHYGQGWPATFRIYSTDPALLDHWYGWALAGDGLSAFSVIMTVAAPVEWWLRRRERAQVLVERRA